MERSCFIIACILLPLAAAHTQAAPVNESYYSSDLEDAVAEAKRNPVNSEYVGRSWYNRSTSKSFPLPKLLNTEMDAEVVEGAMGPTAAGEAAALEAQQPVRDIAQGRKSKQETLAEAKKKQDKPDEERVVERSQEIHVREARSRDSRVTDIRATVNIKATYKP
ncbi:hypothetical protein [Thalassolituus hydrocarboniclasticus]|uniref:Secreted protein n=1 Tax=Thalassolituus hydrocarboniclasticus TaxID=2742796 RepID=A0ABY6ADP3_9GAMM|nr:hypothetical protein [Thalassolituus hydrocarboniclasticus]UXD88559.1 hypothetical protein HUF19_14465 [Thalassolituus hydrocarboniclasticus]